MLNLSKKLLLGLLLPLSATLAPSAAFSNELTPEPRLSTSTFAGIASKNHYPAFNAKSATSKTRVRTIQDHNHGLWVYDLIIDLSSDNDYDGLYSSFTVSLDVESDYSSRQVYAVLYLSQNNAPWAEYAVTDNFTVNGYGPSDRVRVDTSLESGYTSGYYDHYVEVYDAYTDSLLLSYGPNNSDHTANLPLESQQNDYSQSIVTLQSGGSGYLSTSVSVGTSFHVSSSSYFETSFHSDASYHSPVSVSLSLSGSGSVSVFPLIGLIALIAYRRRLHQRSN